MHGKIMRDRTIQVVFTIAVLSLCACAEVLPTIQNPFENKDGNFVLYVSNQSFEMKTVDILVTIDGRPVLQEYFKVGNQHVWKRFSLQLSDGRHKIHTVTRKGEAEIEEAFEVAGKRWSVLNFCYGKREGHKCNKPSFIFEVSDKPVGFL
jgi:hypothetical protein